MGYKLKEIEIKNFGRFSGTPQKYKFPDEDILILGINQDSAGANSNGSGKSMFLNAICWGLTGEILKDISVDQIVRPGANEATVKLQLEKSNSTINETHTIERTRAGKEILSYEVKGKGIKEMSFPKSLSATTIQARILENFNLNPKKYYVDFLNTTYFSSSSTTEGFASKKITNADRMALLTRFLSLGRFDLATKKFKEMRDSEAKSLELIDAKIEQLQSIIPEKYETFEEYSDALLKSVTQINEEKTQISKDLTELKLRFNEISLVAQKIENQQLHLSNLTDSLEEFLRLKQKIVEKEKELALFSNQTFSTKVEIRKVTTAFSCASEDELERLYKSVDDEIKKRLETKTKLYGNLKILKNQVIKPLHCPKCKAPLIFKDSELKLADIQLKKTIEEKIASQEMELNALECSYKELLEKQKNIGETKDKIYKLQKNLAVIKMNQDNNTKRLLELKEERADKNINEDDTKTLIAQAEDEIVNLKSGLEEEEYKTLESSIEQYENELNSLNEQIGAYKETRKKIADSIVQQLNLAHSSEKSRSNISDYDFWMRTFPQIKQVIIENYLPLFEDRINYYLNLINSGFSVRLTTERATKISGIKQEFQIFITDAYRIERLYETFSEGEMRRISICIGLALRDIAKSRNSLPFDFLMIDELVDGLDEVGISEFYRLMKSIPGQKLIISHSDDLKPLFSNVLYIQMKQGVSTILESEKIHD